MKKYKILVVDDNEIACKLLTIMLGDEYNVDVTWNGLQALEMVKNNSYDMVLMDKNMPVMNGLESASKIKELYPELPIISVSMFEHELYETMFDEYVQKPINNELLKNKMTKLLE